MIYLQTTSNYDMPNRNKETSLFLFHSFQFPLVVEFLVLQDEKIVKRYDQFLLKCTQPFVLGLVS
jgi:hypothetical protein